jgi:hypothetical protein
MNQLLLVSIRRKAVDQTGARDVALPAPATPDALRAVEASLGFSLPEDYREILQGVANGGFGPEDGILGIPRDKGGGDHNVVQVYLQESEDVDWLEGLLPLI